jgi:F-type H+-transporting ATPase subunit gamma
MREIKRQIKSTQNMRQITRAMEMVSAAKLKRAQNAALAARPYADKLREVVFSIASGSSSVKHPMLQTREVKRTAYLVITSDRGQAGGLNSNLLKKLIGEIKEKHRSTDEYEVFVIGRKGRDFLARRKIPIAHEIIGMPDSPTFADVKPIASAAVEGFANGSFDELYLVYNEFRNAISQIPKMKKLLPLDAGEFGESGQGAKADYEYEPSAEEVLQVLLPKYAETLIYSAMLDNKASEHGARMTAMGNASKNATKMIQTLTLHFNRARQAAITQEISEIVGGANALQ